MSSSFDEFDYAIVDCETTGLFPGAHHRVIELAVIEANGFDEEGEWSSLINPERDLGDADIHGIRGRDLRDAPHFADVAGTVLELLAGRIVVAHNARFDTAFLEYELARVGCNVAPLSSLCTIAMARTAGPAGGGSRLQDCCRSFGIEVGDGHHALADARACLRLFVELAQRASRLGLSLNEFQSSTPIPSEPWPRLEAARPAAPRSDWTKSNDSYLQRLVASRPHVDAANHSHAGYLDLLDKALEDRRLSEEEYRDLGAAAQLYELAAEEVADIHTRYLDALCQSAWADSIVTERELYDLRLVAELLGLDDLDVRLARARSFSEDAMGGARPDREPGSSLAIDLVGKSVCFTGKLLCRCDGESLTRARAQELATAAGMTIEDSVTRHLDVLVVADPETNSGKARKARQYGTRVIAEARFWPMIGVRVE